MEGCKLGFWWRAEQPLQSSEAKGMHVARSGNQGLRITVWSGYSCSRCRGVHSLGSSLGRSLDSEEMHYVAFEALPLAPNDLQPSLLLSFLQLGQRMDGPRQRTALVALTSDATTSGVWHVIHTSIISLEWQKALTSRSSSTSNRRPQAPPLFSPPP